MTGLDPITLEAALPIVGRALGLTVSEDRSELVDYINKIREKWYTEYDKFKLFNNHFQCICLSEFRQECAGCCDSVYTGFTLPFGFNSVENIWKYGEPLTLHTRWREGHFGIRGNKCGPSLHAIEMAGTFPTERDLKESCSLRIFTENEEDADKCVKIHIVDTDCKERVVSIKLISDGWSVIKAKVKKILSVSLPPDRKGYITLAQNDGYELSRYSPYEVTPNYKRYKVDGCGPVLIQAVGKYFPIYFDHDVVEIGNGLVLEAAAKHFKYGDDSSDVNEINTANMWAAKMDRYMNGLIARHRGGAIQDVNPMLRREIGRKTLPGYRKW